MGHGYIISSIFQFSADIMLVNRAKIIWILTITMPVTANSFYSVFLTLIFGLFFASCSTTDSMNESPSASNFDEAIKLYSNSILKASSSGITKASLPEKTTESPTYVIFYTTTDPSMLTKEIRSNDVIGYAQNISITNRWNQKFCSEKLKSIIKEFNIFMISGQLVGPSGKKYSLSACMVE